MEQGKRLKVRPNSFKERHLSYVLLKDLGICSLWITKVHEFVQQFVADDEIVPDTLLFQLFEVLLHHLHQWEI